MLMKNVFLLRRRSAWVKASVLRRICQLLGKILEPYRRKYQPVLFFDALKAHLEASVLVAAADAGLWSIVIPAKVT